MATNGRKTICTPEIIKSVSEYIRLGNSNTDAALNAGIAKPTFYNWLKRGQDELDRLTLNPRNKIRQREQPFVDFLDAVRSALPQRKATLLKRMQRVSIGEEIQEVKETYNEKGKLVSKVITTKSRAPDVQATAWLLERLHYDEFGKRSRVDVFDWRQEVKALWATGEYTREDVINALGPELASEFFITEGITAIGDREVAPENGSGQPG
jgi:hypothetical protein